MSADAITQWRARVDAEHRARREERMAAYHQRMVDAAGIDPSQLSEQGQRILRWLAEWDDWTTGGIVETLTATRTSAQTVGAGRAGSEAKVKAPRRPVVRSTAREHGEVAR